MGSAHSGPPDCSRSGSHKWRPVTDLYSALYSGTEEDCDGILDNGVSAPCSPNGETGSVVFPFGGLLTAATLTIDMGDFQSVLPDGSILHGAMQADINGIALPFSFGDGYHKTGVRSFVLTPAMLAAANLAGEVRLNLDHTGSYDYIAFDFFRLDGESQTPVPEPASVFLVGSALAGLAAGRYRRRHFSKAPFPHGPRLRQCCYKG